MHATTQSILAIGEVLKSLTENGIGQRIIAAHKDNLEAICQSAHRLFWGYCLGLTVIQMAIGLGLHAAGHTTVGALVGQRNSIGIQEEFNRNSILTQ